MLRRAPVVDDLAALGLLGTAVAFVTAVIVWVWKRIIGPRISQATAQAIIASYKDQNVVQALRATIDEELAMAEDLREEFAALRERVAEHHLMLAQFAPLPRRIDDLQRATETQTDVLQEIKESVGYLRGRVEAGERTFRRHGER